MRHRLCEGPVFTLLEVVQDYVVYFDASIMTFGVVIMQQGRVIAYDLAPPSLWGSLYHKISHEARYMTHDLELGTVVFVHKIWCHYHYGVHCTIYKITRS